MAIISSSPVQNCGQVGHRYSAQGRQTVAQVMAKVLSRSDACHWQALASEILIRHWHMLGTKRSSDAVTAKVGDGETTFRRRRRRRTSPKMALASPNRHTGAFTNPQAPFLACPALTA